MVVVVSQLLLASTTVFISPSKAHAILTDSSGAIVLDARTNGTPKEVLPGAQGFDWRDYLDNWAPKALNLWAVSRNAKLSDNHQALSRKLSRFGFSKDIPVLVYGDSVNAWGEEGRVWWMLRYLGLEKVYILDGGIEAWKKAKLGIRAELTRNDAKKQFLIKARPSLKVDADEVYANIQGTNSVIIDTRSQSEYEGATPHYSARGGHIPNSKHLYWKTLFREDGRVFDHAVVKEKLRAIGAKTTTSIITYCTGGVRSAMVQAVLVHHGFEKVANYDGSWWDWSKQKQRPVEK